MKKLIRNKNGTFKRIRQPWTPDKWDEADPVKNGRMRVYRPDCPRATTNGYALRAHVVWWLHYGECVPMNMELHHKDLDNTNDRLGNLVPLSRSQHRRVHQENWVTVICETCGNEFQEHAWRVAQRKVRYCSQECFHNQQKGKHGFVGKLKPDEVKEIRFLLAEGSMTQKQIAAKFNIAASVISNIKTGKYWVGI